MEEDARSARILVVDADAGTRAQIAEALAHSGYDVCCAADAKAGLRQLAEERFDLLLCAASMEQRPDFELVEAVRSAGGWDLPIVLMSSDHRSARRVHGLSIGADDFVGKPLDMSELAARINALLRRSKRQAQLVRDNLRDPLTMLLNRRGLREAYDREQARISRCGGSLALLVLDLDGFKMINDRHGHGAGDAVLCAVSRVLEGGVRASDRVVRLGGDEFAVLMPDADRHAAAVLSARIRLLSPVQVALPSGQALEVRFCTGLAAGGGTHRLEQLLDLADARMYGAKRGDSDAAPAPSGAALEGTTHDAGVHVSDLEHDVAKE